MSTETSDSPRLPQVGSKILAARWIQVGDWMAVGYDQWKRVDERTLLLGENEWDEPEIIVKFQDGTTETHNELSMCNVKRPR